MGKITPSADPTPQHKGISLKTIPVGSLFKLHPNNTISGIYNCIPISVYIKIDDIDSCRISMVDIYSGNRFKVNANILIIPCSGKIEVIED